MDSFRRKTIQVSLMRIPPQLKDLVSRVPEDSLFTKRHGQLLSLVTSIIEEEMIRCLSNSSTLCIIASLFLITNLCPLWKNFLNSWGSLFLISYLSTVFKETLNLRKLLELSICNHLMSQLIGKQEEIGRAHV